MIKPTDSGKPAGRRNPNNGKSKPIKPDLALLALLKFGELSREQLDKESHSSNSPELVRQLKIDGFEIHCRMQPFINCLGRPSAYGNYRLDESYYIVAMLRLELVFGGGEL